MLITEETVEFEKLDDLLLFISYNPKSPKPVPSGYVLAKDLDNNAGGILYPKDSEIDKTKIERLKKIMENNTDVKPYFVLKRTEMLSKIERQKLYAGIKIFIESKGSRREYSTLMAVTRKTLESDWKNILTNNDLVLYISQLKHFEDKFKEGKTNPFYYHILNTVIFSVGIMTNIFLEDNKKFKMEDITEIALVAFLYCARGWETLKDNIDRTMEVRKRLYIEANKENSRYLKKFELSDNILEAIDFCYQFQNGNIDFIELDLKAAEYAKIVSIAGLYNEMVSGLWGESKTPSDIIDFMYVKANEGKMPKDFVDALAKGMKFTDMFDFYQQLSILDQKCDRKVGKPYPMTGFKSPIIYVCEENLVECKEYVASAKSISVFKKIGNLEEGSYGRCQGLSESLISFYESHYHDIKDEVTAKVQQEKSKSKPADGA